MMSIVIILLSYIMMKRIVFLVFVFLFVFLRPINAHSQTIIITMTPEGFVPAETTIDNDTTVIFLNKDTRGRWPASNVHPTHNLYPDFDPKHTISPNDSWSFKPEKIGTWNFHDHLFPHLRGTLIVTGDQEPAVSPVPSDVPNASANVISNTNAISFIKNLFSQIKQILFNVWTYDPRPKPSPTPQPLPDSATFKQLPQDKQMEILRNLVQDKSNQEAWNYFVETFNGDSGTSGNIHDLAHYLGQLFFESQGFSALSTCTPKFAFGCFHGFLDTAFQKDLTHLTDAEKGCQQLGTGISGPVASCIHGIGHGVASFYKTTDLNSALTACDRLQPYSQQYCYDGVFMEFVRNAPDSFFKPGDPLYPCSKLSSKYQFSCGRNEPQLLLQRFKKSFPEIAILCVSSADTSFREACSDALGFTAVGVRQGNVAEIITSCNVLTDNKLRNRCLTSAAGELIFQEVPGWETSAFTICAATPPNEQSNCNEHLNRLIEEYGRIRPKAENENWSHYVQTQMAVCFESGGKDNCYQQLSRFISTKLSLKESLTMLSQNEDTPAVYARCHELTHYLSRDEYEKKQSIPNVYSQCDSTCHGGCYHGTLEAYLKSKQLKAQSPELTAEFVKICGSITDYPKPLIYYECLHGLGHAAMYVTDMDVPQSLTMCDALSGPETQDRCYTGVFMENSSSSTNNDHPGKYVKADDPMYPCTILDEKYLSVCYRYQSSYFSLITGHNWQQVSDLCLRVPEPYRNGCFRTIGTNQVGFTKDMGLMKTNCNLLPRQFVPDCVAGVISSFAYRFVGDAAKMASFCGMVDPDMQTNCFKQMGASFRDWTGDLSQAQTYCAFAPTQESRTICQQGYQS